MAKKWKPKKGEGYNYVTSECDVLYEHYYVPQWNRRTIQAGNCRKTELEAQKMAVFTGLLWKGDYKKLIEKLNKELNNVDN